MRGFRGHMRRFHGPDYAALTLRLRDAEHRDVYSALLSTNGATQNKF